MSRTKTTVSPEEAAAEKVRREQARRYLMNYATYMLPWYRPGRHHYYVAELLEQVELYITSEGEKGIGRLMIFEPPQHGKSEEVSRIFPSWLLGKNPNLRIILSSYAASLAEKHSRAARNYVMDKRFAALFGSQSTADMPVELSMDSKSVSGWNLAAPHRGGLIASGVQGGITGNPAHLLVIDDPFKDREEAESKARRDLVDEWYKSSAYTRLQKGGAVVVMHTRWHQDDLAGRLIKRMVSDPLLADQWTIVFLPGLALKAEEYITDPGELEKKMKTGIYIPPRDPLGRAPGEALWPEERNRQFLVKAMFNVGPYDSTALYSQLPTNREGALFKRAWFEIVHALPPGCQFVRYWDKAGTEGDGDYSSGTLMARSADKRYFVVDVVRGQWSSGQRNKIIKQTAELDRKKYGHVRIWLEQEPGSGGKESAEISVKDLAGFRARPDKVTKNKTIRAEPLASQAEIYNVFLVAGDWDMEGWLDEICAFPGAPNDDRVDTASGAFNKLSLDTPEEMQSQRMDWYHPPRGEEAIPVELRPAYEVEEMLRQADEIHF